MPTEESPQLLHHERAFFVAKYGAEERERQVGLALSGGGIRSATFSLGLLQAIAAGGVLPRLRYLSTVSGGGYAGAFLGRLFQPERKPGATPAPADVVKHVAAALTTPGSSAVQWLRENGRYLSPRGRADNFFAAGIYLRNLLAIHLNVGLFLLAIFCALNLVRALCGPTFCATDIALLSAFIDACGSAFGYGSDALLFGWFWVSPYVLVVYGLLAYGLFPLFLAYWLLRRKRSTLKPTQLTQSLFCLALAVAAGVAPSLSARAAAHAHVLYFVVVPVLVLAIVYCWLARGPGKPQPLRAGARLVSRATDAPPPQPVESVLTVRNRLAKATAWVLGTATFVLIFVAIDTLGQTLYVLWQLDARVLSFGTMIPLLIALGRLSAPAMSKDKTPVRSVMSAIAAKGLAIAGIVLALLVAVLWSALSHGIMWSGRFPEAAPREQLLEKTAVVGDELVIAAEKSLTLRAAPHTQESDAVELVLTPEQRVLVSAKKTPSEPDLTDTPNLGALLATVIGALLFGLATGRHLEFLNLSSLHQFYQARLARTYLGAANRRRTRYDLATIATELERDESASVTTPLEGDDFGWDDYRPHEYGGPIHIVNMTLNETFESRSSLVYRDRKGRNFALSPFGLAVGTSEGVWDPSHDAAPRPYGSSLRGVVALRPGDEVFGDTRLAGETRKLGEWIAVSGAAFTTGAGSRTSAGQCLLLGLAGVRLGYWWDSGRASHRSRLSFAPKLAALVSELFARFRGPYTKMWYLSDGGHFENTAVYELLRRRLPLIVVSDNGCDGNYDFDDVSNLVRKARIDLHTEIDFLTRAQIHERFPVTPGARQVFGGLEDLQPRTDAPHAKSFVANRFSTAHGALATIAYPDGTEGLLVLIKPSLTGNEPVDVLQYASAHADFPQESTADQFFDEAQWESYRKLGYHIGAEVIAAARAQRVSPHL